MSGNETPVTRSDMLRIQRLRLDLSGSVQGVGFRPHVFRLARSLGLTGWVSNGNSGVHIEVEGGVLELIEFERRLRRQPPTHARIEEVTRKVVPRTKDRSFTIRDSEEGEAASVNVLPDLATCDRCLADIRNPSDRRYRYPFTNCTECGPRYSIIERLPYDRENTTMRTFRMCGACRKEYTDPSDVRFHAQPIACPECGPSLAWWSPSGEVLAKGEDALGLAVDAILAGKIAAIKAIGGYQLLTDASSEEAVARLRRRKSREAKPFAVMVPHHSWMRCLVRAQSLEMDWLRRCEAPIVLLDRVPGADRWIAPSVAPGVHRIGCMLPSTPLHHLLMGSIGRPVVATSGNRSEEPIVTDEIGALARLGSIADGFLVHDRPILNHVDDSVIQIAGGERMVLRRARGFAPLPVSDAGSDRAVVALGGHQKACTAVGVGDKIFVGPHIGDLDGLAARRVMGDVLARFETLYPTPGCIVGHDLHPDYATTLRARRSGAQRQAVQHHHAHVVCVMAEHGLEGPVLGVAWDGAGFGTDGTIWGGEFMIATRSSYERIACLRRFRLPGGEIAAREPRRSALGMLHEVSRSSLRDAAHRGLEREFSHSELRILNRMISEGFRSPRTSSAGRIFDGVASLVGLRQRCSHEAQAAMELEGLAAASRETEPYPFGWLEADESKPSLAVLDWAPMIEALLLDLERRIPLSDISARFHHTLAAMIASAAGRRPEPRVVLGGGCFQNRVLLEATLARLRSIGKVPFWNREVPPNDGGICLGQAAAIRAREV